MTETNTATTEDPAAIEQDIRRTQDEISQTVDRIGDQLTPRNMFNSLLDKADENNVDARMLLDGARRNPVALGLIAIGTIWLISDKDSKIPSLKSRKPGSGYDKGDQADYGSSSSFEASEGDAQQLGYDGSSSGQANDGQAEHGFRERLGSMTDSFRQKRQSWSRSSSKAGSAAVDKLSSVPGRTTELLRNNPMIGGIVAAAAGAALGSALPITRQEQDKLGGVSDKARGLISQQKDQPAIAPGANLA